ncbi:uncharacterized protein LOC113518363 isoform X2 [Galleria mellonella]|uniref:Uncharacterized protein LOC113518363 isoform X2 n=1 Tax=Galleria mellonella TaxID=7137 RepID=A0A6J3C9Z3_GALME|nr:uncharacterized protein LOC113518363 isoform X2 [Galleria mellonella]
MQLSTLVVLACLVAAVYAQAQEQSPAVDALQLPAAEDVYESAYDTPVHDRSPRTKRKALLLLKKKLLLGALGLKAAKIGAVGAGVGALALKKAKSVPQTPKVTVTYTDSWG